MAQEKTPAEMASDDYRPSNAVLRSTSLFAHRPSSVHPPSIPICLAAARYRPEASHRQMLTHDQQRDGRLGVNPAVVSGTPTQSEPRVNTTDSVPSRKKCRIETVHIACGCSQVQYIDYCALLQRSRTRKNRHRFGRKTALPELLISPGCRNSPIKSGRYMVSCVNYLATTVTVTGSHITLQMH